MVDEYVDQQLAISGNGKTGKCTLPGYEDNQMKYYASAGRTKATVKDATSIDYEHRLNEITNTNQKLPGIH